jgi:RNA polymerase sigma factor (sigma-70 family)
MASMPDDELARHAAAGDERAYEAIVRRHEPALRRHCRRLTRDHTRADEAVQQALVSAWTSLRQGTEVRELRPWLFRIAHNAVVRGVTREREHPGDVGDLGTARSVSTVTELSMETRAAFTALSALPDRQRAAVLGTAIEGRSRGEVALQLGLSEGAVRQLLHRARLTMRQAMAAVSPIEPLLRMVRRRSGAAGAAEGASGAPAMATGSAGALATIAKVGAVLTATGAIAAVPAAQVLRGTARAATPAANARQTAALGSPPVMPGSLGGDPHPAPAGGFAEHSAAPPTAGAGYPAAGDTSTGAAPADPSPADAGIDPAATDSTDEAALSGDASPDPPPDEPPPADPPPDPPPPDPPAPDPAAPPADAPPVTP